jgi:hypothetical protein
MTTQGERAFVEGVKTLVGLVIVGACLAGVAVAAGCAIQALWGVIARPSGPSFGAQFAALAWRDVPRAAVVGSACLLVLWFLPDMQERGWRVLLMPPIFWPSESKAETTALIRLGRVLHWIAVTIAGCSLALGAAISLFSQSEYHPQMDPSGFLAGLAGALIAALIGRAFRYVLAGE